MLRDRLLRLRLGQRGERLAARLLKSKGYRIAATNVRFPVGEIDVIAWEGEMLCFIEVRVASSDRWGGAAASIGVRKQQRMIRAAHWYLTRFGATPPRTRFDVVAIDWQPRTLPVVQLIPGALETSEAGW